MKARKCEKIKFLNKRREYRNWCKEQKNFGGRQKRKKLRSSETNPTFGNILANGEKSTKDDTNKIGI